MDILNDLHSYLKENYREKDVVRVLEAGCGSISRVELPKITHLTGIDISAHQLDRNSDLDTKIIGDIQLHEFEPSSFDIVICWDVLEHLTRPEAAVDRFLRALAPGGITVLKLPNVTSLKGVFTKFTPHSFHVWCYRRILGWKDAGTKDIGPFKTFLRRSISPRGLRRQAKSHGMVVALEGFYESSAQTRLRCRLGIGRRLSKTIEMVLSVITLGHICFLDTEYLILLKKGDSK